MTAKYLWETALDLIRLHAADARQVAQERAVGAMKGRQEAELRAWLGVSIALEDLLRPQPADGERIH
jgi:hypothetical protein